MYKVIKSFVSSGCVNPVTSSGRTYWCQCKSGVSGYVLLFKWHVECRRRCWCSCGDQNL